MKFCKKCALEKDNLNFRTGRFTCKLCEKLYSQIYYINNKEKMKPIHEKYKAINKDNIRKADKLYYENNKVAKLHLQNVRYKNDSKYKIRKIISKSINKQLISN